MPTLARAQEQEAAPPTIEAPDSTRPQIGLSIGPGLDKIITMSGDASNPFVFRFSFRFPPREGFSPALMFGWFDTQIEGDQFGRRERIGELQIRPIMVGIRYTWLRDAFTHDVAAAAGPSFSDFDLSGDVARSVLASSGPITADASTSPALKVQVSTWYDINDRVAIRGSLGYVFCRPEITVNAGNVSRRFTQSASAITIGVSAVYRIF